MAVISITADSRRRDFAYYSHNQLSTLLSRSSDYSTAAIRQRINISWISQHAPYLQNIPGKFGSPFIIGIFYSFMIQRL